MRLKAKNSAEANLKFWEEKIGSLTNYLETTKSLNNKSSLNDLPEIFILLNQRQEIIKGIDNLDNQGWKTTGEGSELGDANGGEPLSIPQRIEKILREIKYLDNQLKEKFISWQEEIKKELIANQLNFRMLHTYRQTFTHQVNPRFLDLRR